MKILSVVIAMLLFVNSLAMAANRHLRPTAANDAEHGCANNGNGTTWDCAASPGAAGAYTTHPSATGWTRGDTYYFADGLYILSSGSMTIQTAVSGTSQITLKKATEAEHGIATGWTTSLGDGQATIRRASISGNLSSTVYVVTSYVTIDGVVGSGATGTSSGYGIYIAPPVTGCTAGGHDNIMVVGNNLTNIDIGHIAVENCGNVDSCGDGAASGQCGPAQNQPCCCQNGIKFAPSNQMSSYYVSNVAVHNSYLYNSQTQIQPVDVNYLEISSNYFGANWTGSYCHGQQLGGTRASDVDVNNNIFEDSQVYVTGAHQRSSATSASQYANDRWDIWNNLVIGGSASIWGQATMNNANDTDVVRNWKIHHNTHVGVTIGSYGAFVVGPLSDVSAYRSEAYNNLFYDCTGAKMDNTGCTVPGEVCDPAAILHDYNAYFATTGYTSESSMQTGTNDPFVDSASGDYHLLASTETGTELESAFNTDYDNVSRISGTGLWIGDRGAFQYVAEGGGDVIAPTVDSFTMSCTGYDCTVTAFTASDNTSVTGYMITESATVPGAGDAGWSGSAPSTYTFTTPIRHTLYGWAKDAAGNVSTAPTQVLDISIWHGLGSTYQSLSGLGLNAMISF